MKHTLSACHIRVIVKLAVLGFLLLFSCETNPEVSGYTPESKAIEQADLTNIQKKIVEGSYWAKGRKTLKVRDKTFNIDCSGVVMAIYYYAGIDLAKDFNKYSGGGVYRIYQYLKNNELIYYTKTPAPGDLIFWDNTYDSNGDGKRNDMLTHVAIVVEVSENNTVTYIHAHYRKGIIFENMNLNDPENLEENSAMRMRGTGMDGGWLSSHLYKESGMGYKLIE